MKDLSAAGKSRPPIALPPIILASASERRRDLLAQIGITPTILPADLSEELDPALTPRENAESLALQKARFVAGKVAAGSVIIAADTLVVLDGHILGKPTDAADAARMLTLLSGRSHGVTTGVSVIRAGSAGVWTDSETTIVDFRPLSPNEISAYVRTDEPMGKAGAYAIQGRAALFVSALRGDYSNVVGLPLLLTARLLASAIGMLDLEFLLDIA